MSRFECGPEPVSTTTSSDGHTSLALLTPETALRAQQRGAIMVDVREDDEWAAGHIADALQRPLSTLRANPHLEIAPDQPIVTYCKVGARAAWAATALTARGHTDVRAMAGGYGDWKEAGYPVNLANDRSHE